MLEFLGSRETLVPEVLLAYKVPLGTKDSRVPKDLQVCEATLAVLGKWECPEPPASQAHLVPLDCWDPRVSRAPEGAEDKRVTVVKWACQAERETKARRERSVLRVPLEWLVLRESRDLSGLWV